MEHLNYMATQSSSPERNGLRYVEVHYLQVPPIIITIFLFRCGDGLAHLLTSYEIQSYMSNAPPKNLLKDKGIYQHGVLRKVQTSVLYMTLDFNHDFTKQSLNPLSIRAQTERSDLPRWL